MGYDMNWYYFRRVSWDGNTANWTAYLDAIEAHRLAWNASRPDATVHMWAWNPTYQQWSYVADYNPTMSDPYPPFTPPW